MVYGYRSIVCEILYYLEIDFIIMLKDVKLNIVFREMCGYFGYVIFLCQNVEKNIILILNKLKLKKSISSHSIEELNKYEKKITSHSSGQLLNLLKKVSEIPQDIKNLFEKSIDIRNNLSGYYFLKNSNEISTNEGMMKIIKDMESYIDELVEMDKKLIEFQNSI